jgi:Fe-S-cluster containining protein
MLGRECGECTLCCKLLGVESIGKDAGVWCAHCTSRHGCAIYDSRPEECRNFICAWLQSPALDERWKPSACKFVVSPEHGGMKLKVAVDPARPDAWRKEPFYSYFKNWIRESASRGAELIVVIGKRAIVVLPDRDVDLGLCGDDERVVIARIDTPYGPRFDALKLHKDDPRAQEPARSA